MAENDLANSIGNFFKLLASLGLRAHITGGLASSYYGEPRYTQDVDIVIDPHQLRNNIDQFLTLLDPAYLHSQETIKSSISSGRVFQVIDDATGFKFDIYPREGVPGELSRSEIVELFPGIKLPILSLADCVVSKLQWVKKGSNKSILDIKGIFNRLSDDQNSDLFEVVEQNGLGVLLKTVLSTDNKEPES